MTSLSFTMNLEAADYQFFQQSESDEEISKQVEEDPEARKFKNDYLLDTSMRGKGRGYVMEINRLAYQIILYRNQTLAYLSAEKRVPAAARHLEKLHATAKKIELTYQECTEKRIQSQKAVKDLNDRIDASSISFEFIPSVQPRPTENFLTANFQWPTIQTPFLEFLKNPPVAPKIDEGHVLGGRTGLMMTLVPLRQTLSNESHLTQSTFVAQQAVLAPFLSLAILAEVNPKNSLLQDKPIKLLWGKEEQTKSHWEFSREFKQLKSQPTIAELRAENPNFDRMNSGMHMNMGMGGVLGFIADIFSFVFVDGAKGMFKQQVYEGMAIRHSMSKITDRDTWQADLEMTQRLFPKVEKEDSIIEILGLENIPFIKSFIKHHELSKRNQAVNYAHMLGIPENLTHKFFDDHVKVSMAVIPIPGTQLVGMVLKKPLQLLVRGSGRAFRVVSNVARKAKNRFRPTILTEEEFFRIFPQERPLKMYLAGKKPVIICHEDFSAQAVYRGSASMASVATPPHVRINLLSTSFQTNVKPLVRGTTSARRNIQPVTKARVCASRIEDEVFIERLPDFHKPKRHPGNLAVEPSFKNNCAAMVKEIKGIFKSCMPDSNMSFALRFRSAQIKNKILDLTHLNLPREGLWKYVIEKASGLSFKQANIRYVKNYDSEMVALVESGATFVIKDSIYSPLNTAIHEVMGAHHMRMLPTKHTKAPILVGAAKYVVDGVERIVVVETVILGDPLIDMLIEIKQLPLESRRRKHLVNCFRKACYQMGKGDGELCALGAKKQIQASPELIKFQSDGIEDLYANVKQDLKNYPHLPQLTEADFLDHLIYLKNEVQKESCLLVYGYQNNALNHFLYLDGNAKIGFTGIKQTPLSVNISGHPNIPIAQDYAELKAMINVARGFNCSFEEVSLFENAFDKGFSSQYQGYLPDSAEFFETRAALMQIEKWLVLFKDNIHNPNIIDVLTQQLYYFKFKLQTSIGRRLAGNLAQQLTHQSVDFELQSSLGTNTTQLHANHFFTNLDKILSTYPREFPLWEALAKNQSAIVKAILDLSHLNVTPNALWLSAIRKSTKPGSPLHPEIINVASSDETTAIIKSLPNFIVKDFEEDLCASFQVAIGAQFAQSLNLKIFETPQFVAIRQYEHGRRIFVVLTSPPGRPIDQFYLKLASLAGQARVNGFMKLLKICDCLGRGEAEIHSKTLIPFSFYPTQVEVFVEDFMKLIKSINVVRARYNLQPIGNNAPRVIELFKNHPGHFSASIGDSHLSNFVWSKKHSSIGLLDMRAFTMNLDSSFKPSTRCATSLDLVRMKHQLNQVADEHRLSGLEKESLNRAFDQGYSREFTEERSIYAEHFFEIYVEADELLTSLRGAVDNESVARLTDPLENRINHNFTTETSSLRAFIQDESGSVPLFIRTQPKRYPGLLSYSFPQENRIDIFTRVIQGKSPMIPEDFGILSEEFYAPTPKGFGPRQLKGSVCVKGPILEVQLKRFSVPKGELLNLKIPLSHLVALACRNDAKIIRLAVPKEEKLLRVLTKLYGEPQLLTKTDKRGTKEWYTFEIPILRNADGSTNAEFFKEGLSLYAPIFLPKREAENFLVNFEFYRAKDWRSKNAIVSLVKRKVKDLSREQVMNFQQTLFRFGSRTHNTTFQFVDIVSKAFGVSSAEMRSTPKHILSPAAKDFFVALHKKGSGSVTRVVASYLVDISAERLYEVFNLGISKLTKEELNRLGRLGIKREILIHFVENESEPRLTAPLENRINHNFTAETSSLRAFLQDESGSVPSLKIGTFIRDELGGGPQPFVFWSERRKTILISKKIAKLSRLKKIIKPPRRPREVIAYFKKIGYEEIEGGGLGSHRKLTKDNTSFEIPNHIELATGTAAVVWKKFQKALDEEIAHQKILLEAALLEENDSSSIRSIIKEESEIVETSTIAVERYSQNAEEIISIRNLMQEEEGFSPQLFEDHRAFNIPVKDSLAPTNTAVIFRNQYGELFIEIGQQELGSAQRRSMLNNLASGMFNSGKHFGKFHSTSSKLSLLNFNPLKVFTKKVKITNKALTQAEIPKVHIGSSHIERLAEELAQISPQTVYQAKEYYGYMAQFDREGLLSGLSMHEIDKLKKSFIRGYISANSRVIVKASEEFFDFYSVFDVIYSLAKSIVEGNPFDKNLVIKLVEQLNLKLKKA